MQKLDFNNKQIDHYLERIADGDKEALASLYKETSHAVYGFALSILKNCSDAEDVLQDCYIKIYASARAYRSQGKPLAWILTITRRLCLNKIEKQKRMVSLPQEEWEPYLQSCESLSAEDRLMLSLCLNQLSDEEREIVFLHSVAGFKHREIATMLSIPLPTVLSKYNRSLKKLKIYLLEGESTHE